LLLLWAVSLSWMQQTAQGHLYESRSVRTWGMQNTRIVMYLFLEDKLTSTADGKANSPCSPRQGIIFWMKNFYHCQLWHGYTTCRFSRTCLEVPHVSLSTKTVPDFLKFQGRVLCYKKCLWN
jgi:hypothetical protein